MADNKSKNTSLDIYRKNISLIKLNNIILVLCTHMILLSSFVIYLFCICHNLGSVPIVLLGKGGGGGGGTNV